jgi:asparagine synthase (glutamine-hydrolysing)
MCGISGIIGNNWRNDDIASMVAVQRHRGPDGEGIYFDPNRKACLGHNRLSIIDLSKAGQQPMVSSDGNLVITYNGEIYNYIELRSDLEGKYKFRTRSDSEVLLAAYQVWGERCLERLIGMFAFVIWDENKQIAFAARDRFGVKPFYYHEKNDGSLVFASEIKAIHAAGVPRAANEATWASYLTYGLCDNTSKTFWKDVNSLPAGHYLRWQNASHQIIQWYDLAEKVGKDFDKHPENEVRDEYFHLMKDSVRLRFRSDVPVGINLSGGLDSSTLLGLVHAVQGDESDVKAFTFTAGDQDYDELPWVRTMLEKTNHKLVECRISPSEVPSLAESIQFYQDEPFGGLPTLAYAKLFEKAKENGVTVLLDGNGMDEQWAGYDYYRSASNGHQPGFVQGTSESPVRPDCLAPEFRSLAEPTEINNMFPDKLRNTQYRDAVQTKIPRAMRFNDRISMRSSRELREPFLDHRMFELALRQPPDRKITDGQGKRLLRDIVAGLIPANLSTAPKRAIQTPQREWLRGPLREWAQGRIEAGLSGSQGCYFDRNSVRRELDRFFGGSSDNSFYVWQWISLGLMRQANTAAINTSTART